VNNDYDEIEIRMIRLDMFWTYFYISKTISFGQNKNLKKYWRLNFGQTVTYITDLIFCFRKMFIKQFFAEIYANW